MTSLVTPAGDRSYAFERGKTGVLLLHGLGGTPVELRFVALTLARAGISVSCPQLAGHNGELAALKASTWRDWYTSAERALDRLRRHCDTVIVGGLSAGAVLALMLAAERKSDIDGGLLFAPTLRLDGWGVPWYARLFGLVQQKSVANLFNFTEREPFGVKDPRVRALVTAAIESGDSSQAGMLSVPGGAMFELRHLVKEVRQRVHQIDQPMFIAHPREDDRASLKNSLWLQRKLGGMVETVVLDDSYHVVTVDRQRHVVAERAATFVGTVARERARPEAIVVDMPLAAS